MKLNIKSTKKAYKEQLEDFTFTVHKNGIVEIVDEANIYIWYVVDHLIGANPHLIPMAMTKETDIEDGSIHVEILFVEKSVFGYQSPNED